MSGEPKKPTGTGAGQDWDDDWPTDIKKGFASSSELEAAASARAPLDDTKQYPAGSKRPDPPPGAALPSYVVAYVDVLSGPDVTGQPHRLTMLRTVIGRGPEADLRIKDERMSRRHATIYYEGGEFRIRDEKSANGTFLNGSKVVEYAIRDKDKILVGDSRLQFHLGTAK